MDEHMVGEFMEQQCKWLHDVLLKRRKGNAFLLAANQERKNGSNTKKTETCRVKFVGKKSEKGTESKTKAPVCRRAHTKVSKRRKVNTR